MGKNITAVPYVPIAMLSGSAEIPRYFLKKESESSVAHMHLAILAIAKWLGIP